jgi:hypothetical protein
MLLFKKLMAAGKSTKYHTGFNVTSINCTAVRNKYNAITGNHESN